MTEIKLKPFYKDLLSMQSLHDDSSYWDKKGLSILGREKLSSIKKTNQL